MAGEKLRSCHNEIFLIFDPSSNKIEENFNFELSSSVTANEAESKVVVHLNGMLVFAFF